MKVVARGKRRVVEGTCSACGRPLPHTIAPLPPRTIEEKEEAFDRAQIAFGAPPPRRPAPRMKPETVVSLRTLGCKVLDYPTEGTSEWDDFVRQAEETKLARNQMLDALPKNRIEKFAPDSPERRLRQEEIDVANERDERELTQSEDADAARDEGGEPDE